MTDESGLDTGDAGGVSTQTPNDVVSVVAARRSTRAFTDRRVDRGLIERAIERAGRAPSGGNVQPWHLYVLSGEPLRDLRGRMQARLTSNPTPDPFEYDVYPPKLTEPYKNRRREAGLQLYGAMGIERHDPVARSRQSEKNFDFFGAPAGLFCYVDRQMGRAQWSDLGMYLQTLMLLLKADGVDSCAQAAWSLYNETVAQVVCPPDSLMLFCGVAIGYADLSHPANNFQVPRAPMHEITDFLWTNH